MQHFQPADRMGNTVQHFHLADWMGNSLQHFHFADRVGNTLQHFHLADMVWNHIQHFNWADKVVKTIQTAHFLSQPGKGHSSLWQTSQGNSLRINRGGLAEQFVHSCLYSEHYLDPVLYTHVYWVLYTSIAVYVSDLIVVHVIVRTLIVLKLRVWFPNKTIQTVPAQ